MSKVLDYLTQPLRLKTIKGMCSYICDGYKVNASDLEQEFYLKMYNIESKRGINLSKLTDPYLFITLKNLHHDMFHLVKVKSIKASELSYPTEDNNWEDIFEDTSDINIKENFEDIYSKIEGYIEKDMHFYKSKMLKLNFLDGMSMRKISSETGIGIRSVFNAINKGKTELKHKFQKDYNKFKELNNG